MMHKSDETFATVNGVSLCYDTFGEPSDPAMLLVMGLASQMILWDDELCALLAAQGRFVVRFDNRDVGRSSTVEALGVPNVFVAAAKHLLRLEVRAPYGLHELARDTVGLMDALRIERADFVGASMGGMIVQEIALEFPERTRTMTAMMTTSGDRSLPLPKFAGTRALLSKAPTEYEAFLAHDIRIRKALAGVGGYPINPERARRQGELTFARGVHPAGSARQLLAILAAKNRVQRLAKLKVPTLVVQGLTDPLIRAEHGRALAATIPEAKLELIERMGHALPEQAWPQLLRAIGKHAPG